MNVSNLLSYEAPPGPPALSTPAGTQPRAHQYPTRQSTSNTVQSLLRESNGSVLPDHTYSDGLPKRRPGYDASIAIPSLPKNVAFELLFDGPNTRARLPMRVQIFPHDTTDSIVTTVKNFYGLYDGGTTGVSFEDERGNTLIARYENLSNNMIVYVRVIPDYSQTAFQHGRPWNPPSSMSPCRAPHLDEAFQMPPPAQLAHCNIHEPISRPGSGVARKRSPSPRAGRRRRSVSAQKHHARSGIKSRDTSLPRTVEEPHSDAVNCYSDSDGGAGSVTSSLKARSEQLASAEISVDNIVEGGRRKRAKFESSELPLFVPPQVPAANSISSISPQRRSNGQDNASPFTRPPQRQYMNPQPLPSPQSYGHNEYPHGIVTNNPSYTVPLPASHGHRLRDRSNVPRLSGQGIVPALSRPQAFGILPTPDPTVASCISDEDVALQLMRLGDASNISHGRTSASTLDDALSGRAEIASSASSDGDDESEDAGYSSARIPRMQSGNGSIAKLPASSAKSQGYEADGGFPISDHTQQSGKDLDHGFQYDERKDGLFKSDPDDIVNEYELLVGAADRKSGHAKINALSKRGPKPGKQRSGTSHRRSKVPSVPTGSKVPLSPASVAPPSRKTSSASTLNFQHHLGVDEEDLSSKPRCQRCRKSKKGCDRQRPCQRCKDAGIGVDGCVSEDEGNGRKGRFGRHMGVSVKKDMPAEPESEVLGTILTGPASNSDKSKKRKR
ncbi:MAG: hypothetical protein L6R36_002117 [Xanthoria steineri]|nr:MAG: hypothetical protein L6R36_002117 [Xanthoria steineri]